MAPRKQIPASTTNTTVSVAPIQTPLPVEMLVSEESAVTTKTIARTEGGVKKLKTKKVKKEVVLEDPVPETPVKNESEILITEDQFIEENLEELEEVVPPVPVPSEEDEPSVEKKQRTRTRRVISKETFNRDLENLFVEFASEIDVKKKTGQKLSLQKYLRQLQNDASKLLKLRNLSSNQDGKPKSDRSNSGFMKPVRISQELASFIGVDVNEPITRVEITKKICQYIKENNLQNPLDRRIIEADPALQNIVGPTDEEEKLTYYSLQKRIQSHIFKN